MRFTLLLGLLVCIFSTNEINASTTIERDSLNPLYTDLVNGYQLKVQNLQVLRTMGKNVKLKYDIVNTGKHIVKLGKGRTIPNGMSVIFDEDIDAGKMGDYKAQIAEQILNQNLFIQSGKSATQKEVKVNLSAPAKLAHMIGTDDGSRIADNTMNRVRDGVGSLGNRQGIDMDRDMDVDTDMDVDMDVEMEDLDDMGDLATSSYAGNTANLSASSIPKPSTSGAIDRVNNAGANVAKSKVKNTVRNKVSGAVGGGISGAVAGEMVNSKMDDLSSDMGSSDISQGASKLDKATTMAAASGVGTDEVVDKVKTSRQSQRDAAKREALELKASLGDSEAFDDEMEVEGRELTEEELDTSENLETEKEKWYDGFKPYGLAKDDEEVAFSENEKGPEFLDKSACPDLTMGEIKIIKTTRKWATIEVDIINEGKGPAMIYGSTPKEGDNVYIKAHLSNNNKLSRGSVTLGGMFINKGVSNSAGKLMPGEFMTTQMKIDIKKKTKYVSILVLELDAFGNCRECDETNNKQHAALE